MFTDKRIFVSPFSVEDKIALKLRSRDVGNNLEVTPKNDQKTCYDNFYSPNEVFRFWKSDDLLAKL